MKRLNDYFINDVGIYIYKGGNIKSVFSGKKVERLDSKEWFIFDYLRFDTSRS